MAALLSEAGGTRRAVRRNQLSPLCSAESARSEDAPDPCFLREFSFNEYDVLSECRSFPRAAREFAVVRVGALVRDVNGRSCRGLLQLAGFYLCLLYWNGFRPASAVS